jgi:hypothetical protein
VLTTDQARVLIESIDTSTLVGLRDRALIGVMTDAFGGSRRRSTASASLSPHLSDRPGDAVSSPP